MGDITSLTPLLGVIVGGGVSAGAGAWTSWLSDRRQSRREDAVFWRRERLDAYVEFSAAAKSYVAVLYRLAGHRGADPAARPITKELAQPLLDAAFHRRDEAYERLRYVSKSDEIEEKAHLWVRAIRGLHDLVDADDLTAATWAAAVEATNLDRDVFLMAVRNEINSQETQFR